MSSSSPPSPRRYIYNDVDMEHFLESDAKSELLRVTAAMGKSCASSSVVNNKSYEYDPNSPLVGLSPSMASLHGSLRGMLLWLKNEFPPTDRSKARFGNPAFRQWHTQRLVQRSVGIIYNIIRTHEKYSDDENEPNKEYDLSVLEKASEDGYRMSVNESTVLELDSISDDNTRLIVTELCAYFCASFGHEIRIDYGTGHECSFQVLLYGLCKLGCFGSSSTMSSTTSNNNTNNNNQQQKQQGVPPSESRLKAITISIYFAYLEVTRQIQMEYMLEPAGSHGVWGLDDYHCLPFYFGACQLQAFAAAAANGAGDNNNANNNQDNNNIEEEEIQSPSSIHNDAILQKYGDKYLYYGCVRYIKQLKKGCPFFESSPMLNDISQTLPTWSKVASGLLRLYEGEVLKKRQVVQHFVFGNIFKANWIPSDGEERSLPTTTTFRSPTNAAAVPPPPHPTPAAVGPMARAPWNEDTGNPPSSPKSSKRRVTNLDGAGFVGTKAPWATTKDGDSTSSGGGGGGSSSSNLPPPPTKAPWAK